MQQANVAQIVLLTWLRSVFLMAVWTAQTTWNMIFSILPFNSTSICDTKSDTCQMFCNVTTVWTVLLEFMQLLRRSRSTFVLQRFYIPKVIKTFAKGCQWKYSDVSELVSITETTLYTSKMRARIIKVSKLCSLLSHPYLFFILPVYNFAGFCDRSHDK